MRIFKNKITTFFILQFNRENKHIVFNIFLQNQYVMSIYIYKYFDVHITKIVDRKQ